MASIEPTAGGPKYAKEHSFRFRDPHSRNHGPKWPIRVIGTAVAAAVAVILVVLVVRWLRNRRSAAEANVELAVIPVMPVEEVMESGPASSSSSVDAAGMDVMVEGR